MGDMRDLLERLQLAIPRVAAWMDELHAHHLHEAIPASTLAFPTLAKCFHPAVLESARAVTVDAIPFPPVSDYGLPEFEEMAAMEMAGITFGNMYFVQREHLAESLHVHELVHV